MSDPITVTAAEVAKEIAKQLPIKQFYEDALQPAARATGQLAGDMVKTIQLALAPVQLGGALQDRLRAFIDRSVRAVPENKRVSPAPQILGPVIEAIRYEPDGTLLSDMFEALLSSAMNVEKPKFAHPAFPLLLRQISSDEARIIRVLADAKPSQYMQIATGEARALGHGQQREAGSGHVPSRRAQHPSELDFYFGHLRELGLAALHQVSQREMIFIDPTSPPGMMRLERAYRLMPIGIRFAAACLPNSGVAQAAR